MSKLFIPYETGIPVLAEEKGFDWPCLAFFPKCDLQTGPKAIGPDIKQGSLTMVNQGSCTYGEEYYTTEINTTDGNNIYKTPAPTYQDLLDWFKEQHKIVIYPLPSMAESGQIQYSFHVFSGKEEYCLFSTNRDTNYYNGLNIALKETLNSIVDGSFIFTFYSKISNHILNKGIGAKDWIKVDKAKGYYYEWMQNVLLKLDQLKDNGHDLVTIELIKEIVNSKSIHQTGESSVSNEFENDQRIENFYDRINNHLPHIDEKYNGEDLISGNIVKSCYFDWTQNILPKLDELKKNGHNSETIQIIKNIIDSKMIIH